MARTIRIYSLVDVDRSGKVRWTACELDYEIEESRISIEDMRGETYRHINPYAQVPSATIDGETLVESAAICISLAERHPEAGLIPEGGQQRSKFWQDVNLTNATLELPTVNYFLAKRGVIDEHWAEMTGERVQFRLETFASTLPQDGFLAGAFSLADIFAAYVLRIAVQAELLPYEGRLADYMDRLRARPAAVASRIFDSLT